MKLVYDSMTGNTRRFTEKVAAGELVTESVGEYSGGDALLLTYTFGQGEVPTSTATFLSRHGEMVRGVVSSGSFHWGENWGKAGRTIAEQYGIPLVRIINKGGSEADVQAVRAWINGQMD